MAFAGLWVQLFLALGWTVYVIYLPQLAAQAGLAKQWVPWLLLADQLIFAVMDWTMGTMADRMAGAVERLANTVVFVTLLSCGAFILLPLVAPAGSPALLVAVTVIWSASSSALRAPPWVLIGRHTPGPAQPWASALFLLGIGIAGAVAPYLAVTLRGADPRLPFALSSIALAAATVVMTRAIRANPNPAPREPQAGDPLRGKPVVLFLVAIAFLGLGFQVHFALNAAPNFLRFAKPADLEYLMPVFWIGFNLLILPASFATKRLGGMAMMAVGCAVGGLAAVPPPGRLAAGARRRAVLRRRRLGVRDDERAGRGARHGAHRTRGLRHRRVVVATGCRGIHAHRARDRAGAAERGVEAGARVGAGGDVADGGAAAGGGRALVEEPRAAGGGVTPQAAENGLKTRTPP